MPRRNEAELSATNLVPHHEDGEAVFIASDEGTRINVSIRSDTVWLTVAQMSGLFGRDLSVIRRHVRNVFQQGEVPDTDGYRQILPVTSPTGGHPEPSYNLDVIISVGYRVKSRRGVEFRQWATQVLKERLINDYRRRTKEAEQFLAGMKNVELLADESAESPQEAAAVLDLISKYARAWRLLRQYDDQRLPGLPTQAGRRMARLTPLQANKIVQEFKKSLAETGEATELFARPQSADSLSGIIRNLEQTWGGKPVYPNVVQRAAHLLYFVVKNHPFYDGNKRIGSLLFLHYLKKNGRDLRSDGTPLFDDAAIFALALLVATSDPKQKDATIRVIASLTDDPHAEEQRA